MKEPGECIGFVGLHQTTGVPSLPAGAVEIGWRLVPAFWGNGCVTGAGRAWLNFSFETLGLDEIVSFTVWNNTHSIAVMKRLGLCAPPRATSTTPRCRTPIPT